MDKLRSDVELENFSGNDKRKSMSFVGAIMADRPKRILGFSPLFLAIVALPTLVSVLYFGLLASNVYISESQFVVRAPDKPTATGLGVLIKSAGFGNSSDEIYVAQQFVLSRDALRILNRNNRFLQAYSQSDISIVDRFNPGGLFGSFESLYKYYRQKINIDHDSTTSISTLTVRAYDPAVAQRMNEQLLEMAEAVVNKLNERGRQDLIRFAQAEVDEAQSKARSAGLALAVYRNRAGVVDPEKQATVQLQMISKLQDELIATRTQLAQLRSMVPDNPQIEALRSRIKTLSAEIDAQSGQVAGNSGSLSSAAAQYQRLVLDSQFADKNLASAMASLEDARNEARRKQAYVERIAQPNLPDSALEPRRIRGILSTFAFSLILWGVATMLLAGIKEHQA